MALANRIPAWFGSVIEQIVGFGHPELVAVEQQGNVPAMGHILRAVMVATLATAVTYGYSAVAVHPSRWKAMVGLAIGGRQSRQTKKMASLALARETFPSCPTHDEADAYLLARASIALFLK